MMTIQALQLGGLAQQTLKAATRAVVMGITSKGMFLNAEDKILFVTAADYKSPFNIQVTEMGNLPVILAPGDVCDLLPTSLNFSKHGVRVDTADARIWLPANPVSADLEPSERSSRDDQVISRFCGLAPEKGWLFLSACAGSDPHGSPEIAWVKGLVDVFLNGVTVRDFERCVKSARSMIGLGGGLTPSGDDWLTGFFLFQNRYSRSLVASDEWIENLGAQLSALAGERTTRISANRIAAACQGWAEEMFIEVVDHFIAQKATLSDLQIRRIVDFGHSSGVDTCMGILSASRILTN